MRSIVSRSAFTAALCTGVAMVGVSVHGLVGVDAELQRSAVAARQLDRPALVSHTRDCPAPPPRSKQRV